MIAVTRAPVLERVAPGLKYVVIVAACAVGVIVGTGFARARIDAFYADQAICAARFETWKVRNPILAKGIVRRAWACDQLRDVAPELVP